MERIVQSSFDNVSERHISFNNNGFVHAAYRAYSFHHHLRIRPEDVWFSILTQLSFYINANAEDLREYFVAHKDKKQLNVTVGGSINTVDHGMLARLMTDEIQNNVVDKELQQWILPDFTTTLSDDIVSAAVIMMGSMQKYFNYRFSLTCGIPSVTLLGQREDWVKIRGRLDKIDSWGKEAKEFALRLKVVLEYFILSFDEPKSNKVQEFWGKIAHHKNQGSGPTWLSGWITAFCFWTETGGRPKSRGMGSEKVICHLEGARPGLEGYSFTPVNSKDVPKGYVSVPVEVNDNGKVYATEMLAGSIGVVATSSGDVLDTSVARYGPQRFGDAMSNKELGQLTEKTTEAKGLERTGLDTIQPVTGWCMYTLKDETPLGSQSS